MALILSRYQRLICIAAIAILCFIILVNISYWIWGPQLVRAIYERSAVWPFDRIISHQDDYSFPHYVITANQTLLGLDIFLGLFFLGVLVIFLKCSKNSNHFVLLVLLWTDFCFLAAHLTGYLFWDLSKDISFPEIYLHGLELFLTISFFLFFARSRQAILLWVSFVFFLVFLDDSLRLHERTSFLLAENFKLASLSNWTGVIPKHIWEFVIFGSVGAVALLLFALAYLKSNPDFHQLTWIILVLLSTGFFFAAVVDFVHDFPFILRYYWLTTIIEDWGEMVTLSLMAFFVFKHYSRFFKTKRQEKQAIIS